MTELPLIFSSVLLAMSLGIFIGRQLDNINKRLRELEKPKAVGVTAGVYGRVNEYNVNQSGTTGIVKPKTPQQLEWEESERLREAQLGVR